MNTLVRDLMSAPVRIVKPSATLSQALVAMRSTRILHLPVVGEAGAVVGVVSHRDLTLALALEGESGEREPLRVRDVMSHPPSTIDADRPAHEAAALMSREKVGSLPVLEDGRLVGILTLADFLDVARRLLMGMPPVATTNDEEEPAAPAEA